MGGKKKQKASSGAVIDEKSNQQQSTASTRTKQTQRIIPDSISIKTDLHRLKLLFNDKNINADAITRMKHQYEVVLDKAKKRKKLMTVSVDKHALGILEKDEKTLLNEFKQNNNNFKPIT